MQIFWLLQTCNLALTPRDRLTCALWSWKRPLTIIRCNGSSAFCTLLDATKAFDRVDYCKLFRSLTKRDLPPTVLRLLLNMYTRHVNRVSWNGVFSLPFTVSNGVKQGGVLSPVLFCVYIDSLLHSVAESGVGCFIGRVFVGALVHADDIVLLSPTAATGMRTLLHVCDVLANDFSAVFNAAKSKCLTVYVSKLGASLLYTIRTLLVFFD